LSGISTAVAARVASAPEEEGKTIVVIHRDSGERHSSTARFEALFDARFDEKGLPT